ncbi:MAG: 50S ribosomal protein L29 [Chloroflexota bacterium]|nr:50S ribosomal protein L29 [Chloroflexota bacterium]
MKASEIRAMTPEEIEQELDRARRALLNLRFRRVTGQVENTARFKQLRKDIARLKTISRERELTRMMEETGHEGT